MTKKKKSKVNALLLVIVGALLIAVGYGIGIKNAKEEFDGKKVRYETLSIFVDEKEKELEELEKELAKKQEIYDTAIKVINEQEELSKELEVINKDIANQEEKLEGLNKKVKDKEAELAALEGKIRETGEKPVTLSAGFFTVGKDLPAARYKVTPVGGSGNFFVNDGRKVNIILGNGNFGQPEYVFEAVDGDVIELTTSAKFTPVH